MNKGGKVASLYTTSDGHLAFGNIFKLISERYRAAIFAMIPDELKGTFDRKITTPYQDTIRAMSNPSSFVGDTDENLMESRLVAGALKLFIEKKIPPSSSPINIREPNVENLSYRARLISRDGTFNLNDFVENVFPELCKEDLNLERNMKRHKVQNDNTTLINAITDEQVEVVMIRYVDPNVMSNPPMRRSLELKIRRGIDEEEFINLSMLSG